MPLVSVVVPNFNHARFLPQRLESILAQTFSDFEVIILDDGSTDNSREVIARYLQDPRVRFYANDINSGSPFVQWNRGVSLAHCEFVWIAESDDVANPDFLATLIPHLQRNPDLGLCYCQSRLIDESDKEVGSAVEWSDVLDRSRWRDGFVNRGGDECARFLLWRNTIPNASAVVFRRCIFLEVGGAPTSMRLCGDWMTWARILMRCSLLFERRHLNLFRCQKESVRSTTSELRYFRERIQVQNFIMKHAPVTEATRHAVLAEAFQARSALAASLVSDVWEFYRRNENSVGALKRLITLPAELPSVLRTRFYWGSVRRMLFG